MSNPFKDWTPEMVVAHNERTAKGRLAAIGRNKSGESTNRGFRGARNQGWREIGGRRIYARSRWEANYARYLHFLKESKSIKEWEHEPDVFWFDKIKRGVRSYTPDFKIAGNDGSIEYHEVKGWMDKKSATKIKRMRIYHPSVKLIVIGKNWFDQNRTLAGIVDGWEK